MNHCPFWSKRSLIWSTCHQWLACPFEEWCHIQGAVVYYFCLFVGPPVKAVAKSTLMNWTDLSCPLMGSESENWLKSETMSSHWSINTSINKQDERKSLPYWRTTSISSVFIYSCTGPLLLLKGFSLVVASGLLFLAVQRLLTVAASLILEHRLWEPRLQQLWLTSLKRGLSSYGAMAYFAACEIFPDQGSNQCPLHWQVDSYPLYHQEVQ